jgi:hypothetical protein
MDKKIKNLIDQNVFNTNMLDYEIEIEQDHFDDFKTALINAKYMDDDLFTNILFTLLGELRFLPSTYTITEAIDDVIRCNCDCWDLI